MVKLAEKYNSLNNDKMELEEAVAFLTKVANEYRIFGDLDNPEFEDGRKIGKAIETVLGELESYKKRYELAIEQNVKDYKNSILKKKIEEIKNKYQEKYRKHKAVADKQFEEVGTRECFDNELAIRDLGAIRVCEELLEKK